MGLDIAEILLDIEDAAGVRLTEQDWGDGTVGALVAAVQHKLSTAEQEPVCLSGLAFRRLRRALLPFARDPQGRLRPSTPLDQAFDPWTLKREWHRIEIGAGLKLPALRDWDWTAYPAALAVGTAISAWMPAWDRAAAWGAGFGAALLAWAALFIVNQRLRPRLPWPDLAALTRAALILNLKRLADEGGVIASARIEDLVRTIIADRLALPLEKVRLESHLVRDLGAG